MNSLETRLRAGIVGVGHIGRFHGRHLRNHADWVLVGICDVDQPRAESLSHELDVPVVAEVEELLAGVDALFITTPTPTHYELASKALEAGCHVFLEKPITTTLEQAETLLALANEKKRWIQVGHIERFNPALLALADLDLEPRFIEAHRLVSFVPRGLNNPVVHENMIHDIDIIRSLVASPLVDIQANGVAVVSQHADIANARLRFENGCVANVTASRVSLHPVRKMRIFQPETYITIDFQEGAAEVYSLLGETEGADQIIPLEGSGRHIAYRKLALEKQDAMAAEQASFARAIRENVSPKVTGRDGLEALRIAETINQQLLQQS